MGTHQCLNGTMIDTGKYSNPVPLIGLYTAASTLVCFVLVICDIWSAFRNKKSCLPCRLFSLNAITLTLVAIATKLPVDLTTAMPSVQDQLSKLTGTIFICVSMGVLVPSVGTNRESECLANLGALTIFVVTIVVNICVQMATGIIFSFIVEHAIILFFMVALLLILWWESSIINVYKGSANDRNRDLIRKGEGSMLQRLKICFLYAYQSNPQFIACKIPFHDVVSMICMICSMVLIEVLLRTFAFKNLDFCDGVSDYGWSMWIVVVSQIVTIFLITVAIGCRWLLFVQYWVENFAATNGRLFLFSQGSQGVLGISTLLTYIWRFLPFYLRRLPKPFTLILKYVTTMLAIIIFTLVVALYMPVVGFSILLAHFRFGYQNKNEDGMSKKEDGTVDVLNGLLRTQGVRLTKLVLRNAIKDLERWTEMSRMDCPHLLKLLSTIPLGDSLTVLKSHYSEKGASEVSCLSMLVLAEMTRIAMPTSLPVSMDYVLREAFEITCFIDSEFNITSFHNRRKSVMATVLWEGNDPNMPLRHRRVERCMGRMVQSQSDLDYALRVIEEFPNSTGNHMIKPEAYIIANFIHSQSYASIEELYAQLEGLFVDMLHEFLSQLPKAIFNYIVESPVEEYESRVRLVLKFLLKLESVEAHVTWSFPTGSNITSLISAQDSAVNTRYDAPTDDNSNASIVPVDEDAGEIQAIGPNNIV